MRVAEQSQPTTLSLAEVTANFAHWRSTRAKKGKIPDILWQQALGLLKNYSTSVLSRALGISGEQIKSKMLAAKTNVSTTSNNKPVDFVAINIPNIIDAVNTYSTGKVEVKRPDGATICIDNLTHQALTAVLTQFMRGL